MKEDFDSMMDDLTRMQFSILSYISCRFSAAEICEIIGIDDKTLKAEVRTILAVMGVKKVRTAVKIYSIWIDQTEKQQHELRGF